VACEVLIYIVWLHRNVNWISYWGQPHNPSFAERATARQMLRGALLFDALHLSAQSLGGSAAVRESLRFIAGGNS